MPVPVHTNSIGSATFFDLVGTIYLRQEQIELIERPGTDGTGARLTGERGKPFTLLSIAYHADFAAAKTALQNYLALVGTLQTLTRNSVSYGTFLVVEVMETRPPQAVWNVAGSPGSECRAECTWRLLG